MERAVGQGQQRGSCADNETGQPFPRSGPLADDLDLSLEALSRRIGARDELVYCYVVASTSYDGEQFVQTGCAPNFQGGRITLCTCKHQMRSRLPADAWAGRWVAGFTGSRVVGDDRRYLLYLMRVERAAESQRELWETLPRRTREAKAADRHRLGDLYRPSRSGECDLNPDSYAPPRADHVHAEGWHRDIDYHGRSHRKPALLVGDPHLSFIWDRPAIPAPFPLPRDYKVRSLQELLMPAEDGRS